MNRTGIAVIVIAVVVVGAIAGSYAYTYAQLSAVSPGVLDSAALVNVRLQNVTLSPPRAGLLLTYSLDNPSGLTIIVTLRGSLYYGDVLVANVTAPRQTLGTDASSEVVVSVKPTGSIAQAISQGLGRPWTTRGVLTLTSYALGFVPVTVTETGDLSSRLR